MAEELYMSLDQARKELLKRRQDTDLKKKIEEELGDKLISKFTDSARGVAFRQLCSPDNGFTFFYQCAKYINTKPLILEYHSDIFVHFNEEKKGLGRLRVTLEDQSFATVDIMDFHENEKKKLSDAKIKSGEGLVDFHLKLFEVSGYKVDIFDNSEWFKSFGKASEYYYYFFLHFIAHGVLFETFITDESDSEGGFTRDIIIPAIGRIKERFGVTPIIVSVYPDEQSTAEDFYWWSYPPHVNNYILEYSKTNDLSLKQVSF